MPLGAARITLLAFSPTVQAAAEVIRAKVGVSAFGNAQIDTAQSQFGGASAVFDRTDDGIRLYNVNSFGVGTGDITIEMWFRSVNVSYAAQTLYDQRNTSNGNWPALFINNNSGTVKVALWWNGAYRLYSDQTINANTWYHVALTRESGVWYIYVDGTKTTSSYSASDSIVANDDAQIGFNFNGANIMDGHIDEVRVSNTARYTSNFTPPTTPHVNDDNTLLLLHMDGTDGSTLFEDDNGVRAKQSVRAINNAQVDTADSKFGNASLKVDGENDALETTFTQTFDASGDFTIEMWAKGRGFSTRGKLFATYPHHTTLAGSIFIDVNLSTIIRCFIDGGDRVTTSTWDWEVWNHVALQRTGTQFEMFINGTRVLNYTQSTPKDYSMDSSAGFHLGGTNTGVGTYGDGFNGWFDEMRFSQTARYTSGTTITVPTAPFTNDVDTALLLHMDGTDGGIDFQDDNGARASVGVTSFGNAQVDKSESKFGGASFKSDGTGDYLVTADIDALAFGTGDFTMEAWIYPTATTVEYIMSARQINSTPNPADTANVLRISAGKLQWSNGSAWNTASTTVTNNTWHHVAVSRNSGTLKIFLDGVEDYSATQSIDLGGTRPLHIGAIVPSASDTFEGWIDEVRVSNTARYTSGFTPPTEPFVNDADTIILLHMDGTNGSTTFIDDNG